MTKVKDGNTVKVHYTGKLEDGEVFDTSKSRSPMEFTIGKKQVIQGFEQAVIGMEPGESKTTKIPVDKAYGMHRKELVQEVSRDQLPKELQPKVGQRLEAHKPDGQTVVFTVTNVSGENVTLDANHPLAGKDLVFEIQLIEIV